MAHYDRILEEEDQGPFESVAMPCTMTAMRQLGMVAELTESHRWAVFAGYGLRLQIPSDAELGTVECLRVIVENARAAGAEEVRVMMRKVLGVDPGR
jgi:hypothetical protein